MKKIRKIIVSNLWWIIPISVGQLVDCVTTWKAGIGNESNPAMIYTWMYYGFGLVVFIKFFVVVLNLLAAVICCSKQNPLNQWMRPIFNILTSISILVVAFVCIWNIYWLIV